MKSITSLRFIPVLCLLFVACGKQQGPLVKEDDYAAYLQPAANTPAWTQLTADMRFWEQRLIKNSTDITAQIKMAGLLAQRFTYSGQMNDLRQSDSLYTAANNLQKLFGSSVYRSLASNAITQHRFAAAARYLDTAATLGDNKALTVLQQSDAALELGLLPEAKRYLQQYPAKNSFEYLVRAAKIKDHEGDLPGAIQMMEKAEQDIAALHNSNLACWVKTGLADYYSHNNELKKARRYYKDALAINPRYFHALKGIAWIAFSHDRNTTAARNILNFLIKEHPVPDYHLLLAEVAAYEKDTVTAATATKKFLSLASQPAYGNMYNKYLFELYAGETRNAAQTLAIAEKEVGHRPTPEAYSWLAWARFVNGNKKGALELMQNEVENHCFEPDAVYYMAVIYKENGLTDKARKYFEELQDAAFEKGPAFEQRVQDQLQEL